MPIMLIPAALVLGGFGRRLAGGVANDWVGRPSPGTISKVTYATIVGYFALVGASDLTWIALGFSVLVGANIFVGHVAGGLYGSAGMGRFGPDNSLFLWRRFVRDWAGLSLYGGGSVILSVGCAAWLGYHWLPLLLSGLAIPACYAVSWSLFSSKRWVFIRGVTDNPLTLAEWFTGGCLGVGSLFAIG